MAVSSFNFGPNYIRKLYKNVTKESPGKFTKQYIQKLQKEKMYRRKSKQCKLIFGPSTRLIYFKLLCIHLNLFLIYNSLKYNN